MFVLKCLALTVMAHKVMYFVKRLLMQVLYVHIMVCMSEYATIIETTARCFMYVLCTFAYNMYLKIRVLLLS